MIYLTIANNNQEKINELRTVQITSGAKVFFSMFSFVFLFRLAFFSFNLMVSHEIKPTEPTVLLIDNLCINHSP